MTSTFCPKCNSRLKSRTFTKYVSIEYCDSCYGHYEILKLPCKYHQPIFVRYERADGVFILRKQCFNCGEIEGKGYRKALVNNFDSLPIADKSLDNLFHAENYSEEQWLFRNEWSKKAKELAITKREKVRLIERAKWFNEHDKYCQTEKWKRKRDAVLKRDNYLCQACLSRPAIQAHHLTYEHYQEEPLFDLISVCKTCHDKITQMDRNRREAI